MKQKRGILEDENHRKIEMLVNVNVIDFDLHITNSKFKGIYDEAKC